MSKPKAERGLEDIQAQAITRNMRVSPRKLNLVAESIRNMPAGRALADLTFSKRRIAKQVKKTLESAIANAENNHQLDVDKLVVKLAEVGRGIVMKRFHARGRGRSATVEKWFSHLKIVVEEREPVAKPHARYAAWSLEIRNCEVCRGGRVTWVTRSIRSVMRLGITRTWDSRWYAGKDYAKLLHDDIKLRNHLRAKLSQAGVSKVVIERPAKKPRVTIYAARPGVVIGKKGQDIDTLRKELSAMAKAEVSLNIMEIRKPEIDATLVAENIAQQLERRVAFRRAMKRAVQSAMRLGAQGIKITCGGRLGGAEIARVEWYREGRVPLHTLRADLDYGVATAKTTYGTCGVKVWIFKGEILVQDPLAQDKRAAEQAPQR